MRSEIQHWDQIRANVEVVVDGVGTAGLTPTVAIQRLSDGKWLEDGGASWVVGFETNDMTAVDGTNAPGLYTYAVPTDRLTYSQGLEGYRFRIDETTTPLREHVHVDVARSDLVSHPNGDSPQTYGLMLTSLFHALLYTDANGEDGLGYFRCSTSDATGAKYYLDVQNQPTLGQQLEGKLAVFVHVEGSSIPYLCRVTGYGNDGTGDYLELDSLDSTDLSAVGFLATGPDRLYILNAMSPTSAEMALIVGAVGDGIVAEVPSAAEIADAVLDEALTGHTTAGTLGEAIRRMYGHRENYRVVPSAWASNGQPTAGVILFYDSKAAHDADTGPAWSGAAGRASISATFSGDNLTAFSTSKVS